MEAKGERETPEEGKRGQHAISNGGLGSMRNKRYLELVPWWSSMTLVSAVCNDGVGVQWRLD